MHDTTSTNYDESKSWVSIQKASKKVNHLLFMNKKSWSSIYFQNESWSEKVWCICLDEWQNQMDGLEIPSREGMNQREETGRRNLGILEM